MDDALSMLQDACARFHDRECAPCCADWDASGSVPRALWLMAGDMGLLGAEVPEEYGGAGGAKGQVAHMLDNAAIGLSSNRGSPRLR